MTKSQTTKKIRIKTITMEEVQRAINCNRTFTKILNDNKGFLESIILNFISRGDQRFEELYWVAAGSFHKALKRFDPEKSTLSTYAYKVVTNDLLHEIKKDAKIASKETSIESFKYQNSETTDTEYKELDWHVPNNKLLEDVIVDKVAKEQCLEKFSELERKILELKSQHYTMKEIAEILGKNFHSLRSIHFEACHNPEYKRMFEEIK